MLKPINTFLLNFFLLCFFLHDLANALPEVVISSKKSVNGYILAPASGDKNVILMNHTGKIIHTWNIDTVRAKLLPSCNLLAINEDKLREYTWEGKQVWETNAPKMIHHDFDTASNGNTFLIYRKHLQYLPKDKNSISPTKMRKVRSDVLREVDQKKNVLWEWHFDKHLDYRNCGAKPCGKGADSPVWIERVRDWSHVNTVRVIPENKWYDSGDERFKPGNIITTMRNTWTAYIIEKETKKIVWEYSGDFLGGLRFPHEAHMIPKGYPGAGNLLIFDNGDAKRGSIALEIDPTSNKVVWHYKNGRKFFSNGHGSLMRLPNGNTFISEDFRNRAFEITPENEIVWKVKGINGLRRAVKYSPNYCAKLK